MRAQKEEIQRTYELESDTASIIVADLDVEEDTRALC